MAKRVLVTHASRAGATESVAREVAKVLGDEGFEVDVTPVKDTGDLSYFDAVVLGTALYMNRVMPEALRFVRRNKEALLGRPFACFSVGLMMSEPTEENRRQSAEFLDTIRAEIPPVESALFAGSLRSAELPVVFRGIVKMMKLADGDWRDMTKVATWARGVAKAFAKPPAGEDG